jgi:2-amino-4-hydroxy-6-hydroxymethyldihydropteridine diphosphokinase
LERKRLRTIQKAYVGIGSNLGLKRENCLKAIHLMATIPGCEVIGRSRLYRTEPVGVEDQDWYVNGAACARTALSARAFLMRLLSLENQMGRTRRKKWDSRVIDLDLLLYGQEVIHEEDLVVPHPLLHVRRFVLVPMAELAPNMIHPLLGLTMADLLGRLPEHGQAVIPIEEP